MSSLQKRTSPSDAPSPNDLKQRVIYCLNKLSDRDTLPLATAELESIARNLTHDSFSPFLNCIHNTDSSSKSPVRKQCVCLLTLLSHSHGNSLSPHLSKMVSTVTRRLRDPDSSVRSACVEAASAMSSNITKPPFSTLAKPFVDMVTVEQDYNSQIGAAMCLAAAIEAAPKPEAEQLRKVLPRLVKLVKSEGFKAKAALLSVMGSIVGVGGASSKGVLDWLVPCLAEFLSNEDWATRKAAAQALGQVAAEEKELAKAHKAACLTSLESRRFDKVKVVRETMNRTLELWKEVPGVSGDLSIPSPYRSSSTDNCTVSCFPSASKSSHDLSSKTPLPKKTSPTELVTTAKNPSTVKCNSNNSKTAMFHKLDHKKSSAWKIEIAIPQETACGDDIRRHSSEDFELREDENYHSSRPETKRVLFSSIRDDKLHKFASLRCSSKVVPYHYDQSCYDKDVEVGNPAEEFYENPKDMELIHEQLLQIENQQSSLLDLLQKFIGSSQSGINSLETRVHGLEMALDEISYDLAISSGRIPNTDLTDNTCCKLPGTEFLSSKFWRRTEGRYSTSNVSSSGTMQSQNATWTNFNKDASTESCNPNDQIFMHQNGIGFVMNPMADGCSVARENSGFCSSQLSNNITRDGVQVQNAHRVAEASSATCIAQANLSSRLSA